MNDLSLGNRLLHASALEVVTGLLSSPVICFVVAVALAVVVALSRRRTGGSGVPRGESIALGMIAGTVVLGWIADVVLRGYVFDMSATVSWWRFAVPPVIAAAGLLLFAATRRTPHPRRPVDAGSVSRRTWTTFGPRYGVVSLAALTVVTIVVTVVFGRMSFAFDPGLAAHVALQVPNTGEAPVVTVFPGWAYGIPLIVSVLLLAAATVLGLHRNARRPFSAHLSTGSERAHRSGAARNVTAIAIGVVSIALAGLLRMARRGVASSMVRMTDSGAESAVTVDIPHADLLTIGGFLAPLLEIGGCALLALLVLRALGLGVTAIRRSSDRVEVVA
ncbi:hypothetical protein [Microbacterium testaceum]|uniref:hypothetical protein n=1 Tax=Microbacterium testaceum TaxID=2033 RepID=UPI00124831B2|nr:hypothetical protein [Microbacterium testaceum]